MTEQAYKRATEIKQRIEKLKNEIEWLDNRAGCGWHYRRIFGVKKIPVIRAANKMSYEEYFDLETDDVIALQDRRLKLIWELQKEFAGKYTKQDALAKWNLLALKYALGERREGE